MELGPHSLRVTAVTAFGASASKDAAFTVSLPGLAPVISLVGPSQRLYFIRDGLKITTTLVPESVCDGAKVCGAFQGSGKLAGLTASHLQLPFLRQASTTVWHQGSEGSPGVCTHH